MRKTGYIDSTTWILIAFAVIVAFAIGVIVPPYVQSIFFKLLQGFSAISN